MYDIWTCGSHLSVVNVKLIRNSRKQVVFPPFPWAFQVLLGYALC